MQCGTSARLFGQFMDNWHTAKDLMPLIESPAENIIN